MTAPLMTQGSIVYRTDEGACYGLRRIDRGLLILCLVAIGTRFAGLGYPPTVVFDEVHWGRYFSCYFTGNYYFDVHPPLGKLIYAGWAYLWGFQPLFSVELNATYPESWAYILRTLPASVGSLLAPVVYCLALNFGISKTSAFLAGFLIAIDGALIDISRFVLLDPFLLTLGFGALLAYQEWVKTQLWRWLLIAGFLCGLTLSIKWTGVTFLALIILLEVSSLWSGHTLASRFTVVTRLFVCLLVVPGTLYLLQFWLHFSLLTHSGTGDAFMTPAFQSTLKASSYVADSALKAPSFWEKFLELNRVMYQANVNMKAGHPYSSPWFTWPLMIRPIFLWQGSGLDRIYLLGNPLIWWGSTVAVLTMIQSSIALRTRQIHSSVRWLILGWLMNFLPFMGIGRVMFLYHYLAALVFAILLMAQLIDHAPRFRSVAWILGFLATGLYVYFLPLIYGMHSDRLLFWLSSWR